MITFYDFNELDEVGKAGAVFTKELFVDDRDEGGLKVQLYRLNNFYVEVFYDAEANKITRYHAFKSVGQLANYLRL
ncbi:hypothetical protein [Mucilaginibacter sp. BT774]|uniref:hypothetical protein n=1 Tax=Mucilaginibacter sp. BT774 TaxID=3062276 RepID=UPI002674C48F|nr:hypothetical protein [Mucilaginibacter sp. BT774]MDO3628571.1 hypothetical protein [Mucilaginibacter sp. BT774]